MADIEDDINLTTTTTNATLPMVSQWMDKIEWASAESNFSSVTVLGALRIIDKDMNKDKVVKEALIECNCCCGTDYFAKSIWKCKYILDHSPEKTSEAYVSWIDAAMIEFKRGTLNASSMSNTAMRTKNVKNKEGKVEVHLGIVGCIGWRNLIIKHIKTTWELCENLLEVKFMQAIKVLTFFVQVMQRSQELRCITNTLWWTILRSQM